MPVSVSGSGSIALQIARELHEQASRESNLSRPSRAIRLLLTALNRLDDDDDPGSRALKTRILLTLAHNQAEMHGIAASTATLDQARELSDQLGDGELALLVSGQQGLMAMRSGNLDVALEHLDSAAAHLSHGSSFDRTLVLLNRGALHLYRGALGNARADLTRAVAAAQDAHLPLETYKAKHNLGYLEFLAGNVPKGLALLDSAAREAPHRFGAGELDRARVLVEAGLIREAGETLLDAEVLLRKQRQWQDVAEVELARAECALLSGEVSEARRLAAKARDRFRRRGSQRWQRRAQLMLIQADLADGRPGMRLVGPALDVAQELSSSGPSTDTATAYRLAAQAYLRAGHITYATEMAGRAGPLRRGDPISARLHARLVRAELGLASGAVGDARRELRTGLAELASYQARFGSIDLQTASAVHGRRIAELDLATALRSGHPGEVLLAAERGRATSSRMVSLRPPADPQDAELLSQLRMAVDAAREGRAGQDPAAEAADRRTIAQLQQQLRDRAWTADGSGHAEAVAGIAELAATVRQTDADLVVYVMSAGRLGAVVLGPTRTSLHSLGSAAEVSGLIRRVRADLDLLALARVPPAMRQAAQASLATSLGRLDRELLGALPLADRCAVVVPVGELGMVPWNALPSRRGVPTVVATSASAWCRTATVPAVVAPQVVALAGPALARARDEVGSVAAVWPGARVHHDPAADRGVVRSAVAGADLLHVAAHGLHQPDSPLFSSVRLSDGPLFAHELDPDAGRVSHVVLSACELGRATLRPGDEALGLTSVLLHFGVRSVVAGVARVGDDDAADVMAGYHQRLAKGIGSAEALSGALAGHDAATPVPFVCFGSSWSARTAAPQSSADTDLAARRSSPYR